MNTIFKDLATLVHEQGEMVDSIEENVSSAQIRVQEGADQLRMAERYKVKNLKSSETEMKLAWICLKVSVFAPLSSKSLKRSFVQPFLLLIKIEFMCNFFSVELKPLLNIIYNYFLTQHLKLVFCLVSIESQRFQVQARKKKLILGVILIVVLAIIIGIVAWQAN